MNALATLEELFPLFLLLVVGGSGLGLVLLLLQRAKGIISGKPMPSSTPSADQRAEALAKSVNYYHSPRHGSPMPTSSTKHGQIPPTPGSSSSNGNGGYGNGYGQSPMFSRNSSAVTTPTPTDAQTPSSSTSNRSNQNYSLSPITPTRSGYATRSKR